MSTDPGDGADVATGPPDRRAGDQLAGDRPGGDPSPRDRPGPGRTFPNVIALDTSAPAAMTQTAAVIGGGPAGLMAAEMLARAGLAVMRLRSDAVPGRKLLMAGRGGLNLTHAEPLPVFLSRYGTARSWLEPIIRSFPPEALIAWCTRARPADLHRLQRPDVSDRDESLAAAAGLAAPAGRPGCAICVRHRWTGWDTEGNLALRDRRRPHRTGPT